MEHKIITVTASSVNVLASLLDNNWQVEQRFFFSESSSYVFHLSRTDKQRKTKIYKSHQVMVLTHDDSFQLDMLQDLLNDNWTIHTRLFFSENDMYTLILTKSDLSVFD